MNADNLNMQNIKLFYILVFYFTSRTFSIFNVWTTYILDISSHGSNVLKKILHHLLVLTTENSWDKSKMIIYVILEF